MQLLPNFSPSSSSMPASIIHEQIHSKSSCVWSLAVLLDLKWVQNKTHIRAKGTTALFTPEFKTAFFHRETPHFTRDRKMTAASYEPRQRQNLKMVGEGYIAVTKNTKRASQASELNWLSLRSKSYRCLLGY
jgi:hypothetical protein